MSMGRAGGLQYYKVRLDDTGRKVERERGGVTWLLGNWVR